jgi:hypothetical protein
MDKLLNLTSILSAGLILVVMYTLRRAHIRVEYSVSWLAAGAVVLVLSRWESLLARIGGYIGISYPPAVLMTLTLAVFLVVLYRISMIVSELKDNNIALAQKVAILEFRLLQEKVPGR